MRSFARHLATAVLLIGASWCCARYTGISTAADAADIEDVAIVTTDPAILVDGCDAVNVHRVDSGERLFTGPTSISPSRLAATSDLGTVVAINSDVGAAMPPRDTADRDQRSQLSSWRPFIYILQRAGTSLSAWRARHRVLGADFSMAGGIAVLADNDTLLVATTHRDEYASPPYGPPHRVEKYQLSEIRSVSDSVATDQLGPTRGSIELPSEVAEIVTSSDGRTAHLITESMLLVTIDTESMREVANRVQMAPLQPPSTWVDGVPVTRFVHAELSLDDRYVVTNRGVTTALNVVDTLTRETWSLEVAPDLRLTGGLDFNRGPENPGLLVMYAANELVVYDFNPRGPLAEIGRSAEIVGGGSAPTNSLAWSGRGDAVIAASGVRVGGIVYLFAVFDVKDGGASIELRLRLSDCQGGVLPNDVITANGHSAPPTPTPPHSPTATSTMMSSATPTATATASPTATPVPGPIFLPLAVRERCVPDRMHADIALVIDASTTMRDDRTQAGRTKLTAAVGAASGFVDTMAMPRDQATVVTFNEDAQVLQGLTGRRADVRQALRKIPHLVRELTRIDLGIETAHVELMGANRNHQNRPVMIVLTDGLSNPVPPSTAVRKALDAQRDGITVFTIGLGMDHELNVPELRAMASKPEYFYHAPDGEDLLRIYGEIAAEIPCPSDAYWGGR